MNALLSGSGPEMDTMGQDLSPLGWASSITNSRLFHHSPSGMTKAPHRGHTFFFFFYVSAKTEYKSDPVLQKQWR